MHITEAATSQLLTVYLPDTRGVVLSPFGMGNLKIGVGVHTYSRVPGRGSFIGTCPGSTPECEDICYAKRVTQEAGPVYWQWVKNSETEGVPTELPPNCRLLRLHIGGDFTTVEYIDGWTRLISLYPEVKAWAYTRSWRVPDLLPALERLRALPNVQLFASMDASTPELPPEGWRRAWIDGDPRAGIPLLMRAHGAEAISQHNTVTFDGRRSYVCPEETHRKANCESCGYCFRGQRNDVTFLRH
jgi:hypothetical protein